MKTMRYYTVLLGLVGILIIAFWWFSSFRAGQRAVFRMSINNVAVNLMAYKEKFDFLPPSLDVLCKEISESRKWVYLGYRPLPWSELNGDILLYNNKPSADSPDPLADILIAAPAVTGGARVVAFYRDYDVDKRQPRYIPERKFSRYWSVDKDKLLIPKPSIKSNRWKWIKVRSME